MSPVVQCHTVVLLAWGGSYGGICWQRPTTLDVKRFAWNCILGYTTWPWPRPWAKTCHAKSSCSAGLGMEVWWHRLPEANMDANCCMETYQWFNHMTLTLTMSRNFPCHTSCSAGLGVEVMVTSLACRRHSEFKNGCMEAYQWFNHMTLTLTMSQILSCHTQLWCRHVHGTKGDIGWQKPFWE
jgi:hypothetical protein